MKRSRVFIMMGIALSCCCSAAQKEIQLPAFETWNAGGSTAFAKVEKGWLLKQATVNAPDKYPAVYGDSVVIRMRHSGKGRIIVRLNEFDRTGRLVNPWNYTTFFNNSGKTAVYSPTYNIRGKTTQYFTLTFDGSKNTDMIIEDLKILHNYGETQKLFSAVLSADHWKKVTQGVNLAAGKKVRFYPEPNRAATKKGNTDETDLTDGKLVTESICIYDQKGAVGWQHPRLDRCAFAIDLGSVQPVGKTVLRISGGFLNGTKQGSAGMFPERIDVWVSKDGKNWYKASYLQKLQVNEKADADWKTLYYLPEGHGTIPPYVYPFQLNVNAEARYIYFDFTTAYYIFSMDEIAVLKGDPATPGFNSPYSGTPKELLKKQAALTPFYSEFYVARNVNVPNFFRFDDNRDEKPKTDVISYSIDLPAQIQYIPEDGPQYQGGTRKLTKTEKKDGRVTYHVSSSGNYASFVRIAKYEIGPFYFRAAGDVPEKERYMEMTTFANGKVCGEVKMKLNVIDIPEVPRLKHLMMAGTWFTSRVMYSWPETMKSMRHLGFNALSLHDQVTKVNQKYLDEARKNGFKIIGVPTNRIKLRKTPEAQCTNWKKIRSHNHLCPTYRGKHYQELCNEIVERRMKELNPDYLHLDYEFFFSPEVFASCEKCEALRKSRNMSRKDYAEWAMAESFKGVLKAARRAAPKALIGSYLYCIDRLDECGDDMVSLFGAKLLYPKYLDELHTGCYQTNINLVIKAVRTNYLYTRDPKKVLIYLTAGNGAYFTEEFGIVTYFSLLEAYMNGAYAIAYFVDRSFASPIDYYYMAKGLKLLAPYDEFLVKASMDEKFKGSDPNLTYTLRKDGKDALLLVGNYQKRKEASTFLPLPGLTSAMDCMTGKKISFDDKGINLHLDKYQARLLKLTF